MDRRAKSLQSTDAAEARGLGALTLRAARRIAVAVVGTTLLAIGLVLVFTPGPAIVVLSLGLATLALEFAWARRWLRKVRDATNRAVGRARSDPEARARSGADDDASGS